jgi:prepilin-type N-terminal cleavage/methylation domain-containing protein
MKTWIKPNGIGRRGFTLIELLVVIFIIAVLAGLVLSAVVGAKGRAKKVMAKTEMTSLKGAILMYEKDYSIYPTTNSVDTTYGATDFIGTSPDNAEVLDVLRNVNPANRTGTQGHPRNPRRVSYMEIKPASTPTSPGITASGTYNDPWGNPYIITLDNNFDDIANDPVYNAGGTIRNSVLIWSRGPDGKANTDPNHADNKDNVLGWK